MSLPARIQDPRGTVPIELALGIGILLLPVLLMLATFPTWSERQNVARTAAQEAARAVALAPSLRAGTDAGTAIAQQIAVNHGLDAADITTVTYSGSLTRGASVTATVGIRIPAADLFGVRFGSWTWSASHTELVDLYKSKGEM